MIVWNILGWMLVIILGLIFIPTFIGISYILIGLIYEFIDSFLVK